MWISLTNKLLMQEKGLKCGWIGPSHFPLCKDQEESNSHFISCSYTLQVIQYLSLGFKPKLSWEQPNLEACLRS
jgi:hypothetical protein